jgi:hypothetical protein
MRVRDDPQTPIDPLPPIAFRKLWPGECGEPYVYVPPQVVDCPPSMNCD